MKKVLYLSILILSLYSCTQGMDDNFIVDNSEMADNHEPTDGEWIALNNGAFAQKTPEGYIMEGDIVLSDKQMEILTAPNSRSGFTGDLNKRWPNGWVYLQ